MNELYDLLKKLTPQAEEAKRRYKEAASNVAVVRKTIKLLGLPDPDEPTTQNGDDQQTSNDSKLAPESTRNQTRNPKPTADQISDQQTSDEPDSTTNPEPFTDQTDDPDSNDPDDQPIHGNLRPSDIQDCESDSEALIRMAQDNGGLVVLVKASQLLIAAGLSKSQAKYHVANLHTRLTKDSEWEKVSTGVFRYVPHTT